MYHTNAPGIGRTRCEEAPVGRLGIVEIPIEASQSTSLGKPVKEFKCLVVWERPCSLYMKKYSHGKSSSRRLQQRQNMFLMEQSIQLAIHYIFLNITVG